VGRA
jgi:transposase